MHKIRYYLVVIALTAALSGLSLLGSGSLAHTASKNHAAAVSASLALSSRSLRPFGQCPGGGNNDC